MSIRYAVNQWFRGWEKKYEALNLIEISRSRILGNYDLFKSINPKAEVWPVVKGNAYGHGIKQISEILSSRKFEYVVADSYLEALQVWEVSKRKVLLIGSVHPANYSRMKLTDLTLSIQDKESVEELGRLGKKVRIHLKVNTGMNRQGVGLNDLPALLKTIKSCSNIELEGVFSHLAEADNSDNSYTEKQLDNFKKAIKLVEEAGFRPKWFHLGATAGGVKVKDPLINAMRLGIGLYGINPLERTDRAFGQLKGLRPALRWISRLTKVEKIKKGEPVSYNRTFAAGEDMAIGVVPVGYFEGLDRRLSNIGEIKIGSRYAPILGRVCMNLTVVGLGNKQVKTFDEVEIISCKREDRNSVENMARLAGTIPYDLLVRLEGSLRRVVVS